MKRLAVLLFIIHLLSFTSTAQTFKTPEELANSNGIFVDLEGVTVYYETMGNPENTPVILVHGFGGSTFTWRYTMPALAESGFYAIALDLPPFGLSDKNPDLPYSRSWMADLIAQLMDQLNIETATVVGHSMGGAVTAQFAVRHPERLEKLVFVAGGIFEALQPTTESSSTNNPLNALRLIDPKAPAAPMLLRSLVTRNFFINSLTSAYYDPSQVTPEIADGYARLLLIEEAPVGFLAYVLAEETDPITLENLSQSATIPTLILWGDSDTWVNIQLGERMSEVIQSNVFITYPQVGHLPMEEAPDQFNADLIAFLSE